MDDETPSCGPALTDHDWTIHIPEHAHFKQFDSDGVSADIHSARIVHGNADDLTTAITSHPGVEVHGECNWCALIVSARNLPIAENA